MLRGKTNNFKLMVLMQVFLQYLPLILVIGEKFCGIAEQTRANVNNIDLERSGDLMITAIFIFYWWRFRLCRERSCGKEKLVAGTLLCTVFAYG